MSALEASFGTPKTYSSSHHTEPHLVIVTLIGCGSVVEAAHENALHLHVNQTTHSHTQGTAYAARMEETHGSITLEAGMAFDRQVFALRAIRQILLLFNRNIILFFGEKCSRNVETPQVSTWFLFHP